MNKLERYTTGMLHCTDELRQLIIDNPDLPLLVFAGEDANNGDYYQMSCSRIDAYVGEYLDCCQTVEEDVCFTDRDEFEEKLTDFLADKTYCSDDEFNDDELNELVQKELAEYEPYWKPCIILTVDN